MKYWKYILSATAAVAAVFACNSEPKTYRTTAGTLASEDSDVNENTNEENTPTDETPETPAEPTSIALSWDPGNNQVYEYEVYFGKTADMLQLQGTYRAVADKFDLAKPSLTFAKEDLGLAAGENACFSIVAVNVQGKSLQTQAVCIEQ
jgi:hypothetical protein